MSQSTEHVLVEVTIAKGVDEVWQALRNRDQIERWFGWDAETLADEIEFIFSTHAIADEGKHVVQFDDMRDRFELEAQGENCVLRVVRAGEEEATWENYYDGMVEGWINFVQQLKLAMEAHDLGPRRTLFYSGPALDEHGVPSEELGMAEVYELRPGASLAPMRTPDGAILGALWHTSPFQLGVTVPAWGDGMLIITDQPASRDSDSPQGYCVLTTYGLTDDALAALDRKWSAWWKERYESKNPEC